MEGPSGHQVATPSPPKCPDASVAPRCFTGRFRWQVGYQFGGNDPVMFVHDFKIILLIPRIFHPVPFGSSSVHAKCDAVFLTCQVLSISRSKKNIYKIYIQICISTSFKTHIYSLTNQPQLFHNDPPKKKLSSTPFSITQQFLGGGACLVFFCAGNDLALQNARSSALLQKSTLSTIHPWMAW